MNVGRQSVPLRNVAIAAVVALLASIVAPARAAGSQPPLDPFMREALSLQSAALGLKTGQYLWRDEAANNGAVTIIISIPLQRLYVFRNFQLIGVSTISTGKAGKRTPVGQFEILQKRRHHRSNLYSNAPMPFMQRLTWTGIALHAGYNPGYPASHGCIRMPMGFARLLFGATAVGAAVAVVRDDVIAPPPPEERFVPLLIATPSTLRSREFDRVFARTPNGRTVIATFNGVTEPPRTLVAAAGTVPMTVREGLMTAPSADIRAPGVLD